jgi:chromosome segregation ATPase
MITKLVLRNCMCHQSFVYEPILRLNFLAGANGSGLSAILTAVLFGLGGTARQSDRGSNNKAFIRTGQASASVEVHLYNEGEYTYRPQHYGKTIRIMR